MADKQNQAGAAGTVGADKLRDAVRQMARALANGEWADLLTTDADAAALEAEIQKLVEGAQLARQGQGADLDSLIADYGDEAKVAEHRAAMRQMTLHQAEEYVGAGMVPASAQPAPLGGDAQAVGKRCNCGVALDADCRAIGCDAATFKAAKAPQALVARQVPNGWTIQRAAAPAKYIEVCAPDGPCSRVAGGGRNSEILLYGLCEAILAASPATVTEPAAPAEPKATHNTPKEPQSAVEDAKDAGKWTKQPPTEQGDYWNWDGDEDHAPLIYHVLWSGMAKKCFVSIGQYGIENAIFCDKFGGWWLPIEQPAIPQAQASARGEGGEA